MATRPIFPDTIKNAVLDIEPGDTTSEQDFITAGANGCRVNNISVISDDTSAVILSVFYNDGANSYRIASVNIPTLAGTDGSTPAVSLLNSTDMPFLGDDLSYYLEGADKITIAAQTTVTTAKKISLVAIYGDY